MANFRFLSKFVRKIVEHKRFRLATGTTVVLIVFLSSVFIQKTQAFSSEDFRSSVIATEETVLATKRTSRLPVVGTLSQNFSVYHLGIDIEMPFDDPIHPFINGAVLETDFQPGGYGNYVVIDHQNGYVSLYAHLNRVFAKKGDSVSQDSIIGTVGVTGRSTGSHLHFGVYENGNAVNPLTLLPQLPVATPSGNIVAVGGSTAAVNRSEKSLNKLLPSLEPITKGDAQKEIRKLPVLDIF